MGLSDRRILRVDASVRTLFTVVVDCGGGVGCGGHYCDGIVRLVGFGMRGEERRGEKSKMGVSY